MRQKKKILGRALLIAFLTTQLGFTAFTLKGFTKKYLTQGDNKALAVADDRKPGAAWEGRSIQEVVDLALYHCRKASSVPETCRVTNINGEDVDENQIQELISKDSPKESIEIISKSEKKLRKKYQKKGKNKALAKSEYGFVYGAWRWATESEAVDNALAGCQEGARKPETCRIIDINDQEIKTALDILEETPLSDDDYHAAAQNWQWAAEIDPMTDKKFVYAFTNKVTPHKPLEFPYADTTARLAIGCDSESFWIYVKFSEVNLSDGQTEDGFDFHTIDVRSADGVEQYQVSIRWGGDSTQFRAKDRFKVFQNILTSVEMRFQFDHYGQGQRVYTFKTFGFRAIASTLEEEGCKFL